MRRLLAWARRRKQDSRTFARLSVEDFDTLATGSDFHAYTDDDHAADLGWLAGWHNEPPIAPRDILEQGNGQAWLEGRRHGLAERQKARHYEGAPW